MEVDPMGHVRVTRQELYKQVWKSPMTHVARGYGISDVGLKENLVHQVAKARVSTVETGAFVHCLCRVVVCVMSEDRHTL